VLLDRLARPSGHGTHSHAATVRLDYSLGSSSLASPFMFGPARSDRGLMYFLQIMDVVNLSKKY
jgi:hypothetical protein